MSRASGVPLMELVDVARELPDVFDSIWHHLFNSGPSADWAEPGETFAEARDRMKREREAARAACS